MTTIAVLGAGNIGATLARKWAAADHEVTLGSRQPDDAALRELAAGMGAGTASHADAVAGAEVIVLALPGGAVAGAAEALGHALDGKIVIDATNKMGTPEMNNISVIRAAAPGAIAARAFNSVGWEIFAQPDFNGTPADLLWCGPDGDDGDTVEALITDVGLRPVRVGSLDQIHLVDLLAGLWFALVTARGGRRRLAFKVLTD